MSSVERGCSLECTSRTTISRSSVRAAESLLSGRIQEREYRGRTEMSRKIYNRLSLMAVSWLDESTLSIPADGLDMKTAAIRIHALAKSLGVEKARVVGHDRPRNARNGSITFHHDQYPATVSFI